jgi:regulator of protease activity HflC (stomatin/prohibitin superfamily)
MAAYSLFLFVLIAFVIIILSNSIRILREYERGIVFQARPAHRRQRDLE